MGRDIFDFTGTPPPERLGLPPRADPSATSPPPAAGGSDQAPSPEEQPGRRGLGVVYLLVTLVGLVAIGAGGYWYWSTSGRPDLVVGEQPIANPDEILAAAETLLERTAEADGAPWADARCFFAPGNSAPQVVCGPVWLGVSPDDEPWLLIETRYLSELGGSDDVVGEVVGVRNTVVLQDRDLIRPDGARPATVGQPARSETGPRLSSGSRIVDPELVVVEAEAALADALVGARSDGSPESVSVADDAA
jgi:hypothetical protein